MTASVKTLTKQLSSQCDVTEVYQLLCTDATDMTALLETASISTKEHTRSMIVLSSALRIRCDGNQVSVIALNGNGALLLPMLAEQFASSQLINDRLILEFDQEKLMSIVDEREKLKSNNVMDVLRQLLSVIRTGDRDDQTTLLVGTFSFDCYQLFESLPVIDEEQSFPDYDFYLADRLFVVDHVNHSARLVSKVFQGEQEGTSYFEYQQKLQQDELAISQSLSGRSNSQPSSVNRSMIDDTVKVNIDDSSYAHLVEQAKQHIVQGDVFQIVLARDFSLACNDAFAAYQRLRQTNPSPYMFFVSTCDYQLFGASPESAVKFDAESRKLSIYPIAGTRRRGVNDEGVLDHDLDARIELELKNDEKEKAEHLMLVDLARNDVARVAKSGSRRIDRLLEIDRYSHVMHLVSKVSGILQDDLDALSAYQACMNMGTLSGAPKVKATQLIRQFEQKYRGVYGGAMGYLNAAGDMDTAIVIRSALVADGVATVSAGAGIVFDSEAPLEIKETENKAAAVLEAIRFAQQTPLPEIASNKRGIA